MKIHPRFLATLFAFFVIGALRPWHLYAADSSDDYDENGVKKSYYWQGTQLNNLSRLGSGDFEEEQRHAAGGKDTEEYLAKIRAQMAHQSQADAQKAASLTYQGQLQRNPIEVSYLSPGVRVTLHAEALFDENTAEMKLGSMDTVKRLQTVLDTEGQRPLQLVIADTLDDMPEAKDVDAERSQVILSMLAMPNDNQEQENLTPETLTR